MDEATYRKIIEDYLAGQSSEADFERALSYLKTSLQGKPDLSALFRDLELLGGLSHEEAQEIMPYYLEPLARAQLSRPERDRFVAHLTQCPACAVIYLELRGFEAEVSRVRQVAPVSVTAPAKPWPLLESFLQTLTETTKLLSYSIRFSPALHESNTSSPRGEYQILFEDTLGEEVNASLEAAVTAWRSGPATCDIQVELIDRLEKGRQAGQTIFLTYEGQQFSQMTDSKGEVVFPNLDITKLPGLLIKVEIKPGA